VPFELAGWVLDQHCRSVGQLVGHFGTVSAAGIRVGFEPERTCCVDRRRGSHHAVPGAWGERHDLTADPLCPVPAGRVETDLHRAGSARAAFRASTVDDAMNSDRWLVCAGVVGGTVLARWRWADVASRGWSFAMAACYWSW